MNGQTIQILQFIVVILLIGSILIQQRGSGLGEAFGGSGAIFRTKRGAEKIIFRATIILIVLLLGLSVAALFIGK